MMSAVQPSMLDAMSVVLELTIASPLCSYERPCRRGGRAVLGEPVRDADGECENRSVRCLTCGATGEQSVNLVISRKMRR